MIVHAPSPQDFAVQLHVAHSSTISGVGVFAGQAYHCAVTRFRHDPLFNRSTARTCHRLPFPDPRCSLNASVPVCDGCPSGMTLGYDHCKASPELVDVDRLVEFAQQQSARGGIDPVRNIADDPLYFYRGTQDTCYTTGAVEATLTFYARLTAAVARLDNHSSQADRGANNRIAYEASVGSNHAQPTRAYGAPCGGHNATASNLYSYIESCGYDGAGAVLQHMYGNRSHTLTEPTGEGDYDPNSLIPFDQTAFWLNGSSRASGGIADRGYAYVPERCRKSAQSPVPPCRLHIYHHGCGGCWGGGAEPGAFYWGITHRAGFNEWAEANAIVIIYPSMSAWGVGGPSGDCCWDGYGQTGADYALKSGAQIRVIRNLIEGVAGV